MLIANPWQPAVLTHSVWHCLVLYAVGVASCPDAGVCRPLELHTATIIV